jgi:PAS domain S-box-containing protein
MTSIDLSQLRVLDAIDHAVTVLGRDGRVVAWNPGAEALFGWTAAEATGRRVADLLYTETPHQNEAIRDAIARGEAWVGDYEARRKDGSIVLVHSSVSPVRDDTGEIVATVSVSHDVSERRSLEEMVRQDGERLRVAFETARMGAWSWDATTDVVTWDEHMEARYGLSPGEFGGTFEEYLARAHPDDRDGVMQGVAAVREGGGDLMSEHRVVWPDGTVHWLEARGRSLFDEAGAFLGMVGVGIDIDERKQLEALMLETSQLRTTAGLVSDLQEAERIARLGSWRWEAASNTVTLSAEMSRMLASERTMNGTDFQDALQRAAHPDDAPELTRSANEALRSRRRRYVMECRLLVDGDVRQMVHRGEILLDDDKIVAVRGTFQDVTEQRAAEQALLATRERLARERHAVQVLQETLIRPGFPALDTFDIAARYLPAEDDTGEIGGDWYDTFLLPDGRAMLAVGDVSGHGLSSARLMAKLRHATRAYACIGEDLGDLLTRLDGFLNQFRDDIQIATLLLARLEPDTGKLEFVSAGHPPPLQLSQHESVFLDVRPGPPLGAPSEPESFASTRAVLEPGHSLLFYTDGLVERRNEALDRSLNRLRDALRATGSVETADALCEAAIRVSLADTRREDDVCVLALRRIAADDG